MTLTREEIELQDEVLFKRLMGVATQEEGKQLIKENERLRMNDRCSTPVVLVQMCRDITMKAFSNASGIPPRMLRQLSKNR